MRRAKIHEADVTLWEETDEGKAKIRVGATAQMISTLERRGPHGVPAAQGENAGSTSRVGLAISAGTLTLVPAPSLHATGG